MFRESALLVSLVCVLGLALTGSAQTPDPSLVGWWKLDNEGAGVVSDYSGSGLDGTISGSPQFVPGLYGEALEFHGDPDYVTIKGYKGPLGTSAFTITAWIKTEGNGEIVGWGNNSGTERVEFRVSEYRLRVEHGSGNRQGDTVVSDNQWHHVALTVQENATISYPDVTLYVDGEDDTRSGTSSNAFNIVSNFDLTIARQYSSNNRWFIGLIDDVRLYDRVLSADEIKALATPPAAGDPSPADGAVHSNKWANFKWSAGLDAVSHDVYVGDDLNAVAIGAGDTFQGNYTATNLVVGFAGFPFPDGLVMGTTYYWRIDEKQTDGTTVTGPVWRFRVPGEKAESPEPADGATFVATNVTLGWHNGFGVKLPHLYFGDNFADVESGAAGTYKGSVIGTTYSPASLAPDTIYYWRVDEFDGFSTHTGDVWSFRTRSIIPVYDPNLVAWWKLDDDRSGIVVDSSGNDHHGTLGGDPQYVPGFDGDALELDGSGDFVRMDGYKGILGTSAFTIAAWIRTSGNGQIVGWGNTGTNRRAEFRVNGGRLRIETGGGNVQGDTNILDDQWHHVAVAVKANATLSSGDVTFYLDGQDDTRAGTDTDIFDMTANFDVKIGQMYDLSSSRWFTGLIDDLRIYDKQLTAEEIATAMAPDPRLAGEPAPEDNSTPNVNVAMPLAWTPGESAAAHDIYFGADEQAVMDARISDMTGIYRGRQDANSYSVDESLDFSRTYYWRIDEVEADDTKVHKGRVWSFTVADFIVIDDFEAYDASDNQIWFAWHDGLGYGAADSPPYFAGNRTGGIVGDETTASYTEETIVQGGSQSMPLFYDNSRQGHQQYSEAEMTLQSHRNWTAQGVKALSLWFRGHSPSAGSFAEGPAATYTMTSRGADIWGRSDEFHFAYKQLTGAGSIVAKVESMRNSNNSAKAGVMIRDTLEANSVHAMMVVTPAQGVAFQRRTATGDTSFGTTEADISAPQWVRIDRDLGGNVTAWYSHDGSAWTQMGSQPIIMNSPMYVGLALTSHAANITCEATFSNVEITGTAAPQWAHQDIGILSNDPEPLYIALAGATGAPAVVFHADPNAALIDTWTEWNIDLAEFAGVNLTDVNSIAIGLGDRDNPEPGGSGKMYFDDIRLYRPRCLPSLAGPDADLNNDCIVDNLDLEIMASEWLKRDSAASTAAPDATGLVAHYRLDGNADDSSGYNHHGVEKAGAGYVAGVFGRSLHLDGFDDYVAISDMSYAAADLRQVTVSAWIRTTSPANQHIVSFDRNEYWRLQLGGEAGGPGLLGWSVMTSSGQVDYGSARRVDDGQWHHVAGVFGNGILTMYIDAGPEASVYGGSTFGTGNTRFGFLGIGSEATEFDGRPNATGYFEGDLDEVRIYDSALTQAEIAWLADETPEDGRLYIPVPSAANIL
ncbi:MAG: LamG domain-containing protein, partial [Planctomycetota bacterium]